MRLPILPTLSVALATGAMVALGVWQLDRRDQKETLIAQYRANALLPDMTLPTNPGSGDAWRPALFRKVTTICPAVIGWSSEAGRAVDGARGWRKLARCGPVVEGGTGLIVDMGVSDAAQENPAWPGGTVTGVLTEAPSHASLIARALGRAPAPGPLLVSAIPAAGLKVSAPPSPETVPNNHLAYAVQWFLFAGIAIVIYGLALRRRNQA